MKRKIKGLGMLTTFWRILKVCEVVDYMKGAAPLGFCLLAQNRNLKLNFPSDRANLRLHNKTRNVKGTIKKYLI